MTQIDIAALVADLTENILGVERDHAADLADAELTGERPDLSEQEVTIPLAQASDAVAALIAQDAEIKRLRGALEFYADEKRTGLPSDGPWGAGSTDFGRIARAALGDKP